MQKFNLKYILIVNLLLSSFNSYATPPNRLADWNNIVPDTIAGAQEFAISSAIGLSLSLKINSGEAPVITSSCGFLTGIICGILQVSANLELAERGLELRVPSYLPVIIGTVGGSLAADKTIKAIQEFRRSLT